MSRRRSKYEFSRQTKREAKLRAGFKCEQCGAKGDLEAHHVIAVWTATELGLWREVVKSINNCEVLCPSCHAEKHNPEPTLDEYKSLAQAILGAVQLGLL